MLCSTRYPLYLSCGRLNKSLGILIRKSLKNGTKRHYSTPETPPAPKTTTTPTTTKRLTAALPKANSTNELTRPPKLFKIAILFVGAQLIYNTYYLWQGWVTSSQESIENLGSTDDAKVTKTLDGLLDMLYEKCNRCEGCLHNKPCNYFPENHSLFVERMYEYQIGKYLPRLIAHEDTTIRHKATAILVALYKYDHIIIQALDNGLTNAILKLIVEDKGTQSIFNVINGVLNRKKLLRHLIRDEKALELVRDLAKKDVLHNVSLYFTANIVVNKAFHMHVAKMKVIRETVRYLSKSRDANVAKDGKFLLDIVEDKIDMYEKHIEDRSIVDRAPIGHEGKVTASILLSGLTFGVTYYYCLQRWKRLSTDMLFCKTKSIVGAAGVVLCVLNFFHYDLPPSDKALALVDENLRYVELHHRSLAPPAAPPTLSSQATSQVSKSVHTTTHTGEFPDAHLPPSKRNKTPVYNWYVSPVAFAAGLAAVVGSRYYVLLAWYYSRYTVLPSIIFSAFAIQIRDQWVEDHFRTIG